MLFVCKDVPIYDDARGIIRHWSRETGINISICDIPAVSIGHCYKLSGSGYFLQELIEGRASGVALWRKDIVNGTDGVLPTFYTSLSHSISCLHFQVYHSISKSLDVSRAATRQCKPLYSM